MSIHQLWSFELVPSMINGQSLQGIDIIEKTMLIHNTSYVINSLCNRACKCQLWAKISVRAEKNSKENTVSETYVVRKNFRENRWIKPRLLLWVWLIEVNRKIDWEVPWRHHQPKMLPKVSCETRGNKGFRSDQEKTMPSAWLPQRQLFLDKAFLVLV